MINQFLKSCTRELDFRLNFTEPLQSVFSRTILTVLHPNRINTFNLIDAIDIYLSTYGIYFRNADHLIIANLLQTLFHHTSIVTLLGRSLITIPYTNPTPFAIAGDKSNHIIFTHRHEVNSFL